MRSGVAERSRKAVAVAGTRDKRRVLPGEGSAATWREERGKRPEGPWRPGKTKNRRNG